MYFLILLSLVLTVFKLASMQTNPFDEYTWREKQYLQLVTNFHKVSITGKIKLILDDFILRISKRKSNVSEELCKPDENTFFSPPAYYVTSENRETCRKSCYRKNTNYVQFLNNSIYEIKIKLFEEEAFKYIVFLRALHNAGDCVQQDDRPDVFKCECYLNYKIHINSDLNSLLNIFMNGNLSQNEIDFAAILYLLKFHAKSAPVFVSWLLYKYGVLPKKDQSEDAGSSSTSLLDVEYGSSNAADIVSQYAGEENVNIVHQVKNDEGLLPYDEKLFELIRNVIQEGECHDSHAFPHKYFNEEEIIQVSESVALLIEIIKHICLAFYS